MLNDVYKKAKLDIFERFDRDEITASQKKELLTLLEAAKEESELNEESIKNFFDQLKDQYSDKSSEIEKIYDKVTKLIGDEGSDDGSDEEEGDSDDEEVKESTHTDAMLNLLDKILESVE